MTNTQLLGKKVIYLPVCQSTNDVAADMVANKAAGHGNIVITSWQQAGKGQRGNQWEAAPDQNLTFSLVLNTSFLPATRQFYLNMALSLGVAEVLSAICQRRVYIKWPNDLICQHRKIGGILIENTLKGTHLDWSIAGIGININQTGFAVPTATSVCQITGKQSDLHQVLEALVTGIEKYWLLLEKSDLPTLRHRYLPELLGYQEIMPFADLRTNGQARQFIGEILGVGEDGRLALRTEKGLEYFAFKELQWLNL